MCLLLDERFVTINLRVTKGGEGNEEIEGETSLEHKIIKIENRLKRI